jgi:hypothetical protein
MLSAPVTGCGLAKGGQEHRPAHSIWKDIKCAIQESNFKKPYIFSPTNIPRAALAVAALKLLAEETQKVIRTLSGDEQ